jgi:outer membrane protein assembly factor BamB
VTGKDTWRKEHSYSTSWSSPLVHTVGGRAIAVVSSSGAVAAFDVKTGEKVWEVDGLAGNTVASPTPAGKFVLVGSSERASQLAISLDSKGTTAWRSTGATSSFGSPLVYGEYGYSVSKEGVAYCFEPGTGKEVWDTRLPASCWASPVGGAGHVYFFTRDGLCVVVKPGPTPDVVAENPLPV